MAKPTKKTGFIAFGKDGSAEQHVFELPSTKVGQEEKIAIRFVELLSEHYGLRYSPRPLPENDNDYVLVSQTRATRDVKLEIAELAFPQWTERLNTTRYREGAHPYTEFVMEGPDDIYGVDTEKRRMALSNLVASKVGKNYSKPAKMDFWLLIFSVAPGPPHVFSRDGSQQYSEALQTLLVDLWTNGKAGPFDAIWLLEYPLSLARVWSANP
ncbi:MAG: hypothetical protein V4656_02445 [Pseudomonadota bacterium]